MSDALAGLLIDLAVLGIKNVADAQRYDPAEWLKGYEIYGFSKYEINYHKRHGKSDMKIKTISSVGFDFDDVLTPLDCKTKNVFDIFNKVNFYAMSKSKRIKVILDHYFIKFSLENTEYVIRLEQDLVLSKNTNNKLLEDINDLNDKIKMLEDKNLLLKAGLFKEEILDKINDKIDEVTSAHVTIENLKNVVKKNMVLIETIEKEKMAIKNKLLEVIDLDNLSNSQIFKFTKEDGYLIFTNHEEAYAIHSSRFHRKELLRIGHGVTMNLNWKPQIKSIRYCGGVEKTALQLTRLRKSVEELSGYKRAEKRDALDESK
jgi:hypothetical protein